MQVGDKRQAGMLGVAAVGAVGFLVFQLVPKADAHAPKPVAAVVAGTPGANATPQAVEPIPPKSSGVTLQRDPFAVTPRVRPRPSIAPETPIADAPAESAPVVATKGAGLLPPAMIGSGPIALRTDEPPETGEIKPSPAKTPSVVAPKPPDEPKVERAKISVSLLGVVEMPIPVAMLRVGDAERTLRRGDEIVPGFRIAKITLAGITFVNRPGLTLAPGEETNL